MQSNLLMDPIHVHLCYFGHICDVHVKMIVPRHQLSSAHGLACFQCRSPRPSVWNSKADYLHDPAFALNSFRRQHKTFFLHTITHNVMNVSSASETL